MRFTIKAHCNAFILRVESVSRSLLEEGKEPILVENLLDRSAKLGAAVTRSTTTTSKAGHYRHIIASHTYAKETFYSLKLVYASGVLEESVYLSLKHECKAIVEVLNATRKVVMMYRESKPR